MGLDVLAVLLWLPVTSVDTFAPLAFGPWWLLPPAILVLLACLGFWMVLRGARQNQRPLVFLQWTSVLVLSPLVLYAFYAVLFATFPEF